MFQTDTIGFGGIFNEDLGSVIKLSLPSIVGFYFEFLYKGINLSLRSFYSSLLGSLSVYFSIIDTSDEKHFDNYNLIILHNFIGQDLRHYGLI